MKKQSRSIKGKITKLSGAIKTARAHKSIPSQLVDLVKHKLLLNITFRDYYKNHFYNPGISWDDKCRYICKNGSIYWPYQNNPLKFTTTLSNKYIQKHLLSGFGLPTPSLLFTVGPSMEIETKEAFLNALNSIKTDFLLKPINGAGGNNICVIENRDNKYFECGSKISANSMWVHMKNPKKTGFFIEERVSNAAYINDIFPNCLNTFRIVTIKTRDGKQHIPWFILKIGRGDSQVDNQDSGGFFLHVNDQGLTESKFPGIGDKHPDTGAPLVDIKIENYEKLRALAVRASECFGFLGTIGWDIADTDQGLMIIEGNTLWGPVRYPILSDEIMHGLNRNSYFSRWDKNAMHPDYNKAKKWRWIF